MVVFLILTRKDLTFRDKTFQSVAILHEKIRKFSFFFSFNSSFIQNISHCNTPLGRGFPMTTNLLNLFKCSKSYSGSKN